MVTPDVLQRRYNQFGNSVTTTRRDGLGLELPCVIAIAAHPCTLVQPGNNHRAKVMVVPGVAVREEPIQSFTSLIVQPSLQFPMKPEQSPILGHNNGSHMPQEGERLRMSMCLSPPRVLGGKSFALDCRRRYTYESIP